MGHRHRAVAASIAAVAAVLAVAGWCAGTAGAATTCTWGGTPADPTGTFALTGQPLTNTPSTGPLPFTATGPLAGGCKGTFTFRGQFDAGSTCTFGTFEGSAIGLPGVVRFAGEGAAGILPSRLYGPSGDVVGLENPHFYTVANAPRFIDCNTPQGLKGGNFSSVIELFR
jgi:hypothetical protein